MLTEQDSSTRRLRARLRCCNCSCFRCCLRCHSSHLFAYVPDCRSALRQPPMQRSRPLQRRPDSLKLLIWRWTQRWHCRGVQQKPACWQRQQRRNHRRVWRIPCLRALHRHVACWSHLVGPNHVACWSRAGLWCWFSLAVRLRWSSSCDWAPCRRDSHPGRREPSVGRAPTSQRSSQEPGLEASPRLGFGWLQVVVSQPTGPHTSSPPRRCLSRSFFARGHVGRLRRHR